jgi:dolichyl-phosphate beta-glucosyltransferase
MVDADGATEITDLGRLEQALDKVKVTSADEAQGVAVGSRAHLQNEAVAKRSLLRTVLMHGFHTLVVVLGGVKDVRDTQCGFKLFTRAAARRLFHNVHLERWCFDVEVLYIAQCLGIPVAEVAVNWTEIDGSHLDPLWSAVEMFKDLLLIRTFYLTGTWRLEDPDAKKRR